MLFLYCYCSYHCIGNVIIIIVNIILFSSFSISIFTLAFLISGLYFLCIPSTNFSEIKHTYLLTKITAIYL